MSLAITGPMITAIHNQLQQRSSRGDIHGGEEIDYQQKRLRLHP